MRHPRLTLAIIVAALSLWTSRPALAAWKVLAIVKADKGLEREEVKVRTGRGFRQVKLKADAADVEIKSLHVVYGSGEPDKIEVRKVLRAGSETLPLALKGGDRVISKVVLWYATPERETKKAIVTIYGND